MFASASVCESIYMPNKEVPKNSLPHQRPLFTIAQWICMPKITRGDPLQTSMRLANVISDGFSPKICIS
ncbi:hypothetical protein Fmac_022836 [Flemingia macrophylla]|uniref:Uncharacterized protein n=1 Tax=Flemingia macrophylla TaxID=520843 RepID=A0ABD1M0U7_9FABA